MEIKEIKDLIEQQGSVFEQFKKANDDRLKEIEKKGSADAVTEEKVNKLNEELEKLQKSMKDVEIKASRPDIEQKDQKGNVLTKEQVEHKAAFNAFLRKGIETDLGQLQHKALSVGSDPDGGYVVTPTIGNMINTYIYETTPMRQYASVITIGSDSFEFLLDNDEATAGWTSEQAARTESNTPQFAKASIPVHEIYAMPKATQKLIDDANIDIESWLAGKVAEKFARKENDAFINGDGIGKPKGILSYTSGTTIASQQIEQVTTGSSGAVTSDSLLDLLYSLKDAYARNAAFIMNRSTSKAIRKLKDTTNQYIWAPGLTAGAPDTLLGRPLIGSQDMPVPAASSLSIACADFKSAYQIVDRVGVRVLRDPFTDKPFIKFYTTKRVGGGVVNFEAIKILKLV